jgi:hypothetical protein
MSSTTKVMRPSGRTYRLDLTTSASNALLLEVTTNDQSNYVSLLCIGTGTAAVELGNASGNVRVPVVATTGGSGSFVLPPNMTQPLVLAAPPGPFYLRGVSSSTNTIYATPVQSD